MDPNAPGSLEEQIADLRSRVGLLEQALKTQGILLQRSLRRRTLSPMPPFLSLIRTGGGYRKQSLYRALAPRRPHRVK